MDEKVLSKRVIYYDYLRVLATIAVIMIHVAAINWSSVDVNGLDWKVFNFYDSIARWGVPVFIMISGALFLDKDDISIKKIYKKYVARMVVAYFVWSFVYYLVEGQSVINQVLLLFRPGKTERIVGILNGHYHLWFVPMITGIYICVPVIKQIVRNEAVSTYFLIVSFVFWFLIPESVTLIRDFGSEKIIMLTNAAYGRVDALSLEFVKNYIFYFILGYKISKIKFKKTSKAVIYVLGIIGFAFTIIVDNAITLKLQTPTGTYYGNSYVNVLFEAIAVFEVLKNVTFKENWFCKVITDLSRLCFGAYLVHALVIETLTKEGINTLSFNSIVATPVMVIVVFAISFLISAVLNCIPWIRKYCV